MDNNKYKEVLQKAIDSEVEAYDFYRNAAEKVRDEKLRAIFEELAQDELNHIKTLEALLEDNSLKMSFKETDSNYKIAETIELPKLKVDILFTDGVASAMKWEEEAMNLYNKLANASNDPEQKELFLQLAKTEQIHKVKLEDYYNNAAFIEAW